VQSFLKTEVAPDFELVPMLAHGVGVHHAGLSDEIRSLMEWLAEQGSLISQFRLSFSHQDGSTRMAARTRCRLGSFGISLGGPDA
jgi:hypothetical protein